MRILLKGYYGFGNLGDDILMLTSCGICKHLFPAAEITVMTAGHSTNYIQPFTKGMVEEVIPVGSEPEAQVVIFGGGGVFYDFQERNFLFRLLNSGIDMVGPYNWSKIMSYYRGLKGMHFNKNAWRVGLGVGVGKFTAQSGKYFHKITELAQFHWLYLRDPASYEYVKGLKLPINLRLGTDLAHLTEFWMPELTVNKDPRKVALVLKHWPDRPEYLQDCGDLVNDLVAEGYIPTIFLFEQVHDQVLVHHFPNCQVKVWDPNKVSLEEYLSDLAMQSVVITSRAHGAIIGAALGIPAICLGIEPKLKAVSNMFPRSGQYLDLPLSSNLIGKQVAEARRRSVSEVERDFKQNQNIMKGCLAELKEAYNIHAMA